jgi:hypothetical protein
LVINPQPAFSNLISSCFHVPPNVPSLLLRIVTVTLSFAHLLISICIPPLNINKAISRHHHHHHRCLCFSSSLVLSRTVLLSLVLFLLLLFLASARLASGWSYHPFTPRHSIPSHCCSSRRLLSCRYCCRSDLFTRLEAVDVESGPLGQPRVLTAQIVNDGMPASWRFTIYEIEPAVSAVRECASAVSRIRAM